MSGGNIKSKDLSYDSSLPPFLQRLRAQNTGYGDDGDPDRHERPLARPKKAKNPDDDDGPTFVDESGETVTKEDYEKQLKGDAEGEEDAGNVTGELKGDGKPEALGALPGLRVEQKLTDGAAAKKRKMAKVVGEDEEDGHESSSVDKGAAQKAPKKAKKKTKIDAESDEAYARNLQAEINGEKRATRGGGATKKKPAAKQAKKPKKKSSSKVSAADDSDLASGSEKPEKEKKGGFHVSVFYCVRQVAILTNFLETHEPLRATGRNAWSAGPLTTTDCKADLGICQGA